MREKFFKNLANILTALRLVAIVPILILIYARGNHHFLYALATFCVAMPTDFLDGYVARKLHQTSAFGQFFDPLVDKTVIYACLFALFQFHVYAAYILFPMFLRDFLVDGLRNYYAKQGRVLPANFSGKAKFTCQALSIIAGLWFLQIGSPVGSVYAFLPNLALAGGLIVSFWGIPILFKAATLPRPDNDSQRA
jgi:CDP-diacylglycerol---glycerol-3-phosphate 3-phosphatidyltransferase